MGDPDEQQLTAHHHHHHHPQKPLPQIIIQQQNQSSISNQTKPKTNDFNEISHIAENLINGSDMQSKIQAARDVRRVIRSCVSPPSSAKTRSRLAAAGVIYPLVDMLSMDDVDAREAALLALLNLAVRNDGNKVKIVTSGAVPPLVELLQNSKLPELATAAILTLSSAAPNKPIIASSGAGPLLVKVLGSGSIQSKVDAVTALYNLSTCTEAANSILDATAVPHLINLLKDCKKYSKFAEKTTALLEILSTTDEGRTAISNSWGGILALVETVEDGSRISMEHAVGALLTLCQSCKTKYRELILNEGAIPGLLRLTAEGTVKAQERAKMLLDLLRDSPGENRLASSVIQDIVYDIASKVDDGEKAPASAQRLLQDMLHRSMELSMSQIKLRASSYTPSEKQTS